MAGLATFALVRDLIEVRCGLRFDDSQQSLVLSAIALRKEQLQLNRDDEYIGRLRGETSCGVHAELRNLLSLVTITETSFFRDPQQFRLMCEHIVPGIDGRVIRIWSAGCATGEEAYSIAIALDDMGFFRTRPDVTVEIVGTDINLAALETARRGVFPALSVRNVGPHLLDRYFARKRDEFELSGEIRTRVMFEFGNLAQMSMPSNGLQNIVFCKNVAIYFRPEGAQRLIRRVRRALAPGGYLLLGHAESIRQPLDDVELVEYQRTFCYRKRCRPVHASEAYKVEAPVEPGDRYGMSLREVRAGNWSAAESALLALIGSSFTFVPAYLLLGGVYANRGRYDAASVLAQSALKLNNLEPRAHLLLGMIATRRGQHDDAVRSLKRALYLNDSLALGHFWLGNIYRERGDVARACGEYENVVRGWKRSRLEFTEEFAADLNAEQLVGYCNDSLQRLRVSANG